VPDDLAALERQHELDLAADAAELEATGILGIWAFGRLGHLGVWVSRTRPISHHGKA
jgi:hypothetical protein